MTTRRSEQEKFALAISDLADAFMLEYYLLENDLNQELNSAADEGNDARALLALAAFLTSFEALVTTRLIQTVTAATFLQGEFGGQFSDTSLYSSDTSPNSAQISERSQLLIDSVRRMIDQARRNAGLIAGESGRGIARELRNLITASELLRLRKALDFAIVKTISVSMHEAGTGIFAQKIAIPVIDKRTTDLCRNRMAYQVRGWDELYLDPETGASWMTPPFVGDKLPQRESFHYCRSISTPEG